MSEQHAALKLPPARASRSVRIGPRTIEIHLSDVEVRANGGDAVVQTWATLDGTLLTLRRLDAGLTWERCSQILRLIHQALLKAASGFYPPVDPDYGDPTPKIEYRPPADAPRLVDGAHNYWDRPFFFTISVWLGGVTPQGEDAELLKRLGSSLERALRQIDSAIDLPVIERGQPSVDR